MWRLPCPADKPGNYGTGGSISEPVTRPGAVSKTVSSGKKKSSLPIPTRPSADSGPLSLRLLTPARLRPPRISRSGAGRAAGSSRSAMLPHPTGKRGSGFSAWSRSTAQPSPGSAGRGPLPHRSTPPGVGSPLPDRVISPDSVPRHGGRSRRRPGMQ